MGTLNLDPYLVTFDTTTAARNTLPYLIDLNPVDLLLGSAVIDGKTETQTTILTVPAGKTCIPTKILFVMTSASEVTGVATVTVGETAGWDTILGSTALTNFDATGQSWKETIADGIIEATANPDEASVVKIDVATAATTTGAGDTYTFIVYLFGALV